MVFPERQRNWSGAVTAMTKFTNMFKKLPGLIANIQFVDVTPHDNDDDDGDDGGGGDDDSDDDNDDDNDDDDDDDKENQNGGNHNGSSDGTNRGFSKGSAGVYDKPYTLAVYARCDFTCTVSGYQSDRDMMYVVHADKITRIDHL
jgi:hypothetical protein